MRQAERTRKYNFRHSVAKDQAFPVNCSGLGHSKEAFRKDTVPCPPADRVSEWNRSIVKTPRERQTCASARTTGAGILSGGHTQSVGSVSAAACAETAPSWGIQGQELRLP